MSDRAFIPARITRRWLSETVPTLPASKLGVLLEVLAERGWTDEDLAPYLGQQDAPPATSEPLPTQEPKIEPAFLTCSRFHWLKYDVEPGVHDLQCSNCMGGFLAVAAVRCRSLRQKTARGSLTIIPSRLDRMADRTLFEMFFDNPDPPPAERVVRARVQQGIAVPIRSGHVVSLSLRKRMQDRLDLIGFHNASTGEHWPVPWWTRSGSR